MSDEIKTVVVGGKTVCWYSLENRNGGVILYLKVLGDEGILLGQMEEAMVDIICVAENIDPHGIAYLNI